ALFGSCSKRTSSTSTTSMLSFVSARNSRSRSSIKQRFQRNAPAVAPAHVGSVLTLLVNGLILVVAPADIWARPINPVLSSRLAIELIGQAQQAARMERNAGV